MKNKSFKINMILIIIILSTLSCNKSKNQSMSIIENWYKTEIKIPENLVIKSMGQDTSILQIINHRYKVLIYIDSLGCTACKLKLYEWQAYINKCQLNGYDVGFLFAVHSTNYKDLEEKLYEYRFKYPIIYDSTDKINKINKLPTEDKYRTFLLDERNRVILIGSPITNDKIRKLYTEILGGGKISNIDSLKKTDSKSSSIIKTSVQLNKDSVNLGKFSFKTTKHVTFKLKNTGNYPLLIQDVSTSCGCTVAKYDKKPVPPGESTTVVLEYKPYSLGYFSKTADVVCNVPEGYVRLKISGEVVEK